MPVTRELSVTYGGETFGGSSARQITGYSIERADWQSSAFEFDFITTAASDAAFKSEIDTIRNTFRTPRGDLVVTQNSQNLISWKQTDNTGFDANPEILKDGDPADTGRSRKFRIRIEFGQPADRIGSVGFRRYSTYSVNYDEARRRTVTVEGAYTANSTNGTTDSFDQYRAEIVAYAASITTDIDSSAKWEIIGEPQIQTNETKKVTTFSIVAREIIHNQKIGQVDETSIVDPVMKITVERFAPGDSTAGGFTFGGAGLGQAPVITSGTVDTVALGPSAGPGNPGQTTTLERPMRIIVQYGAAINKELTTGLTNKWKTVIRPFLISEAARVAGRGVTLIKEDPGYLDYGNRIDATMEFLAYMGEMIEQKITVRDRTGFGKVLAPVTSKDPYDYYEFPGPATRQRTVNINFRKLVGDAKPESVLDGLVMDTAASVNGLTPSDGWMPAGNDVGVATLKQGLDGAEQKLYAEVQIERVAQRRNKRTASVANAGGVTGAGLT